MYHVDFRRSFYDDVDLSRSIGSRWAVHLVVGLVGAYEITDPDYSLIEEVDNDQKRHIDYAEDCGGQREQCTNPPPALEPRIVLSKRSEAHTYYYPEYSDKCEEDGEPEFVVVDVVGRHHDLRSVFGYVLVLRRVNSLLSSG